MAASRATDCSSRRRAFTLVELMVAIAVLTILILMLSTLFNSASRAWIIGESGTERRGSVRALADYIAIEMQGALLPVERVSTVKKANLQFLLNPNAQLPPDCRNADAVFWQAPLATETSLGDIAEIGYFVKWPTTPGSRPALCRFFVNPSVQDAAGKSTANPEFLIYKEPNAWLTPTLLESIAPATKAQGYRGLFAENILGLWVRCYGLDGTELAKDFDSREGYDCEFKSAKGSRKERRYLPATVHLSLAQVDSHYAHRLDGAAAIVRGLVTPGRVKDAVEFLETFRAAAQGSPATAALLPGVRIYSLQVQLQNAR